jgi:hypothetical protein
MRGQTEAMTIEITIRLPESPDIRQKIGDIAHAAAIVGGQVYLQQFVDHHVSRDTPPEAQPVQPGNLTPGVQMPNDERWDEVSASASPDNNEGNQEARPPSPRRRR